MKVTNFNITDFENSKKDTWMLGSEVIYGLCSNFPKHTKENEVRAKIWLIGRSHAVAIERRKKNLDKKGDWFYDYAIREFIKFSKKERFDEKLSKLKNKKFDEAKLKEILILHNELVKFFKELTGLEKRSLASKYLHFHMPIFPIYDSRANRSIKKIVKGNIEEFKLIGDKEYSKFCYKILFLYEEIKKQTGKFPTLREIDTFLVKEDNERLKRKKGTKKINVNI
jgi:hypothetical protein